MFTKIYYPNSGFLKKMLKKGHSGHMHGPFTEQSFKTVNLLKQQAFSITNPLKIGPQEQRQTLSRDFKLGEHSQCPLATRVNTDTLLKKHNLLILSLNHFVQLTNINSIFVPSTFKPTFIS